MVIGDGIPDLAGRYGLGPRDEVSDLAPLQTGSKSTSFPWYSASSSRHSARVAATVSRSRV